MSGFVGILNPGGEPVDRELLARLTRAIAYRGPDAEEIQLRDNWGFGHTMLRTTREADREHQPCTLDGEVWIVADCRVDARKELIADLEAKGRQGVRDATDPELILHAYAVWGADCTARLLGDFSFAIHDYPNRRLFCARDHLGIKLFYYARDGGSLIFGNTLSCLRLHPAVSSHVNDKVIGDILLFGYNQDLDTTSFQDIQVLPASHRMVWNYGHERTGLRIDRYWTLVAEPVLRLRHNRDYETQFLDLLRTAMRDRMRTGKVVIFLSGGLDSGGIAAIAKELAGDPPCVEISAHTAVYDRLLPDRERYYSQLTAAHLGMPVRYYVRDDEGLLDSINRNDPSADGGEQIEDPAFIKLAGPRDRNGLIGAIARETRVAFFGEGPDNALFYDWKRYVRYELGAGSYGSLLKEAILFPFQFGSLPFAGRWLRFRPRRAVLSVGSTRAIESARDAFPAWLDRDFAARCHLRDRFDRRREEGSVESGAGQVGARLTLDSFLTPLWRLLLEEFDPGISGVPLELRHPYLDIRLLRYLVRIPAIPWCRSKYIMRRALRTYLPETVLQRPKEALAGSALFELWKIKGRLDWPLTDAVSGYVDRDKLRSKVIDSFVPLEQRLRVYALDFFLRNLPR